MECPTRDRSELVLFVCLFVCLFGFLTSSSTTRLYRGRAPRQERLTILRAATHETELGDHDFCLSRSHYTDTDPTCRERAATAGIEPGTSSPGVARSTAELPVKDSQESQDVGALHGSGRVYDDILVVQVAEVMELGHQEIDL